MFKKGQLYDFNLTIDSAVLEGVGLTYNNATNTLSIDSAEKLSYINENTIHFYKARLPNQEINLSDEHSDYKLITAEDINKLSKKFQPAIKEVLEQWQTSEQ